MSAMGRSELTEAEAIRARKYLWPSEQAKDHPSDEELCAFAEQMMGEHRISSREEQKMSEHLLQCDRCLGDFVLLKESLEERSSVPTEKAEFDLSFLDCKKKQETSSLWNKIAENVFRYSRKLPLLDWDKLVQLLSLKPKQEFIPSSAMRTNSPASEKTEIKRRQIELEPPQEVGLYLRVTYFEEPKDTIHMNVEVLHADSKQPALNTQVRLYDPGQSRAKQEHRIREKSLVASFKSVSCGRDYILQVQHQCGEAYEWTLDLAS